MKIEKAPFKARCEMGGCKCRAEYVILMDRVGIKSRIYICSDCLKELYCALGGELVPKSIETLKAAIKKA